MNSADHSLLREQVQHNCHLSDAQHARDYSLCIYLLKMREYFRWEQGYTFTAPLPKTELGEWLRAREQLWERIESSDYQPLVLQGETYAPFDADLLNSKLRGEGLIYSGGYCGSKPHFFLAELERHEQIEGNSVYLSSRELARELTAPPAMMLNGQIFLRRESLRRMIWEKLEEWGWQDPERAIARAVAFYRFPADPERALEAMTDEELNSLLQHELGEVAVGRELGSEWEAMLASLPRCRAEYELRAIRDHLVDCRYTLPRLLNDGRDAAVHFFFANFTSLRKEAFPALQEAYQHWLTGDHGQRLKETLKQGEAHWAEMARRALLIYRETGDDPVNLKQRLDALSAELPL